MQRNQTIDFLRGLCMLYIVGVFHLTQYLGEQYYLNNNVYGYSIMWSCLGTFSLISGYLLGMKYECKHFRDALFFYKKRIIRFYPLFILSAILLLLIGFNDLTQTVYALTGMAPFVAHTPKTLWYISMIMIFYLISPIVLTSRIKRLIFSVVILLFFCLLSRIIRVDLRFLYNLMLYLLGISVASFKFEGMKGYRFLKWVGIVVSLLVYSYLLCNLSVKNGLLFSLVTNVFGVFALVSLASLLMKIVPADNRAISFMSFASMSCYLFHRFTYWLCLQLYNPDDLLSKTLYLVLIAFPVGLVFAFYVQKLYDVIALNIQKKS